MIPPRILLAGLACLCPFTLAQKLKSDPHKTLIIISTSDMHGNLEKFPKLATLVKQYRAKYPHVLLVDSGDYFMGNPYVDDWEKRGEPLTVLMNKLKYDIVTIGNHDLDYGQEALRDHIKGMPGTKFVVTNVNPSPTLENCFSPYASIPIKGTPISIGFIGLVDLQTTDVRRMSGISWKLPDEEDYKGITDRFRLHHNTINVILSHLGSGTVNGYFDVTRHTDKDWKRMIGKAPHSMFDIVGRYSMMILHTEYLKAYSPDSITKSVRVWDESVRAMWKIMGFDKYPQPHNNRQLGVSVEGGAHMFATWYYCGYSVGDQGNTLKNEVLAPGVLQGNRLWGFGHEVGHCYQHPFNWRSMSESSNNFFAQLILDQVTNPINGNELASDMENPCKYLLSEAVKGLPFHDLNGWAKWGFAQYSFYLYFHKLGINPEFYPALFESLRRKPLSRQAYEVSEAHLALYERICNVSRTDFTDDFEIFNWFVPIDHKGNQYGDYSFKMTEEMARASKARIAARRYPKPKFRIAFLHQHGKTVDLWGQNLHGSQLNGYWTKYKQNAKLSPSVSASKKDSMIIVRNGENAAAFCVVTNGKVVGYYDRQKFDVSGVEWNDTSKVYAIPIQTAEPYKLIYSATRS